MGNVVVWKLLTPKSTAPSHHGNFQEGANDGVINLVTCDGPVAGEVVFKHRDFAGLHFTGSTGVFRHLWKTIGGLEMYRSYLRIVGETGLRCCPQKRGCGCGCGDCPGRLIPRPKMQCRFPRIHACLTLACHQG